MQPASQDRFVHAVAKADNPDVYVYGCECCGKHERGVSRMTLFRHARSCPRKDALPLPIRVNIAVSALGWLCGVCRPSPPFCTPGS
jgi:hypothetical protein